ncbi:hypothetical protein AWB68_08028 [Caballeronia choica]|uniref:Lipoprotein n=1 Tax=Caballeronia choica TaxID=326476 RepID=A0A158KZ59_9BURK|nr:hypothetical protein [Caballeronia choica]SAL86436.1 hypothetical protein AWB68_08028 [Caballeronia choica]
MRAVIVQIVCSLLVISVSAQAGEPGDGKIHGRGRYYSQMNTFFVEQGILEVVKPNASTVPRLILSFNAGVYSAECAGMEAADGPWISLKLMVYNRPPIWLMNMEELRVEGPVGTYVHVTDITANLYAKGITADNLNSNVAFIDFLMGGDNCQHKNGFKRVPVPQLLEPAEDKNFFPPSTISRSAVGNEKLGRCTNGHDCPACTSIDGSVTAPNACCININQCVCDQGSVSVPFPRQSCN